MATSSVELLCKLLADDINTHQQNVAFSLQLQATAPRDVGATEAHKRVERQRGLLQLIPFGLERTRNRRQVRKEPIVSLLVTHPITDRVGRPEVNAYVEEVIDHLMTRDMGDWRLGEVEAPALYSRAAAEGFDYLVSVHRLRYGAEFIC